MKKAAGGLLLAGLCAWTTIGRIHPVSLDKSAPDTIEVEIKGEVASPGVYTVKNGADVEDLIKTAGGETAAADVSHLSLMEELSPGQVIIVSKKAADGSSLRVSLNTASEEELTKLPGIGPAMAARIIEYRSSTPFAVLEDLKNVKGIGDKTFEKLKEFLAL